MGISRQGSAAGLVEVTDVATAFAEALAEHDRDPRTDVWVSFWDRLTDGGPIPPRPTVKVTLAMLHALGETESEDLLIEEPIEFDVLGPALLSIEEEPVEVTDEMVERAYRAFLGSDSAYVPNRVGLRNMRAALCAALERTSPHA